MLKLKQYLNHNKSILLIYFGIFLSFSLYTTISYCLPGFFLPAITYFSAIRPEFWAGKAIDSFIYYSPWVLNKTIEYAPAITFYTGVFTLGSIGGIGLLYTGEFIYNRNYIINKYLESTPIVGHALKGYKYLFTKPQDNPEYVHVVKNIIDYVGLLPKSKVEIREVEKLVTQTVEKPVVSFRDRSQLRFLHNKLDQIEHSVLFINDNSNFYNLIVQEMKNLSNISNQLIREDCEFIAKNQELPNFLSNLTKIKIQYVDVSVPIRSTLGSLIRIARNPGAYVYGAHNQPRFEIQLFGEYLEHTTVQLNKEFFKTNYPKIYLLLENKFLTVRNLERYRDISITLNIGYKNVGRGIFGAQKIEPSLFSLEYPENGSLVVKPIMPEIEAFFDISMRTEKETIQQLTAEVRGFILDNTNSEIDVYLERRLQTDALINKSKDLMELELYIKAKRARPVSFRTSEPVSLQEQVIAPENTDVINPISAILQNPLMTFAVALSTFVVSDFHNIELAAKTLLGFTSVPGWDNTFLEFSRLSISELQTTYNFTQSGAEKAREIIDYISNLRNSESVVSHSGYEPTNVTNIQIPWGKIMYVSGALLLGAGVTWLYFKSIQAGIPVEEVTPVINNLSPQVNDWHNHVLSEIDKL